MLSIPCAWTESSAVDVLRARFPVVRAGFLAELRAAQMAGQGHGGAGGGLLWGSGYQ